MKLTTLLLFVTATSTALIAGLFYSYSVSVIPGLGKLTDAEYLKAFQSINREIQNPSFFISFFGTLLLLPIITYIAYNQMPAAFPYLAAATATYFIGVMGVTIAGNIPLNNTLDNFNITIATTNVIAAQRAAFEAKWNMLNNVRTLASLASIILVLIACLKWKD